MPEFATPQGSGRHDIISVLERPTALEAERRETAREPLHEFVKEFGLGALDVLEERRLSVLSDLPAEIDSFGFAPFVRVLSEIVLSEHTQMPLAIALDGAWGSGKTSVMKMVEKQARLVNFPCVTLNAWALENPDHLIAAVAAAVRDEIKSIESKGGAISRAFKEALNIALKVILKASGSSGQVLHEFLKTSANWDQAVADVASVVSAQQSFHELTNLLIDAAAKNERQDEPPERKQQMPERNRRLIVFIDDIDRALPDQIVATLKTLKMVLENPRCVFVLGMDMNIVARSIESFYVRNSVRIPKRTNSLQTASSELATGGDFEETIPYGFGQSYLEKLFQIQLGLPGLSRDLVLQYVDDLRLAPEVIEIIRWAPDSEILNPRRLKRYVNWLSIAIQLIVGSRLPNTLTNSDALRFLALRRDYREIYYSLLHTEQPQASFAEYLLKRIRIEPSKTQTTLDEFVYYCRTFLSPGNLRVFEESLPGIPLLRSITGDLTSQKRPWLEIGSTTKAAVLEDFLATE